MKSARVICCLVLIGVSAACAGEATPDGELGQHAATIVGGRPSDASENAVVVLVRGAFVEYCTAIVIAPTVVMTARHCLYGPVVEDGFYDDCESPVARLGTFAWQPTDFAVQVGYEKPLLTIATGKEIYTSDELDRCTNELALLELDVAVPIEPLPLRLDGPPRVGEEALLVGWGFTATDEPILPDPRQQRESRVLQLGPDTLVPSQRYIDGNSFVSTEGGCGSDEGAPLISASTGAVIGVQHGVSSPDAEVSDARARSCLGGMTVLQRIDLQAEWIRTTLRRLGTAPWIEGKAAPAGIGASCADADECLSGVCLGVGSERYCSASCAEEPCPEGMACMGAEGGRVCTLDDVSRFDASGGCAMARDGSSSGLLGSSLWLATVLLRRRGLGRWSRRSPARHRPSSSNRVHFSRAQEPPPCQPPRHSSRS